MSLHTTKSRFISLLNDPENKVIALSGKWGTGKTHLWQKIKEETQDELIRNGLYVSLFGVADLNQAKLKIVQSAIPNAARDPSLWQHAGTVIKATSKTLKSLHKGFSALDELALLAVPSILKNKYIVIDDIERKHEKLSVDEILGFIDEFTQLNGARFILILNDDKLSDLKTWETFREKVIDQEIRLDTTPDEAFAIAESLSPTKYSDEIRNATNICRINNIRVLIKIIRTINQILEDHDDLESALLNRVIPSAVLITAIHYKGIEDGPTFEYVLNPRSYMGLSSKDNSGERGDDTESAELAQKAKWQMLLQELNINGCDAYEPLLIDYLQSGLLDSGRVKEIIRSYAQEHERMEYQERVRDFHYKAIWYHQLTDAELLSEAESLIENISYLNAYEATGLSNLISELDGGQKVADKMIDTWIKAFGSRGMIQFEATNFFDEPLHPRIKEAFEKSEATNVSSLSLFQACEYIVNNNGWGKREEAVLRKATIDEFELTIKSLSPKDLHLFMKRFLKMRDCKFFCVTGFSS